MKILPIPKSLVIKEGFLKSKIVMFENIPDDERIIKALECFQVDAQGTLLEIKMGNGECEEYTIEIENERIVILSEGAIGVFYAIQTLKQIFMHNEVPCCTIADAPDFKHRGFYHDVTRGKIPNVKTLKKLIDNMALYKLNSLQLYVEHAYEFDEHKDSKEKTGFLTAEELKEIDNYCKLNFIEFIPSLATFGHLYELLQKDRYKHLRELEDFDDCEFFWENRMQHHTIDPTKNESFELVKSLIDQYIENFSSNRFNICCDETFDLKNGKHRDEDTGKLYIDFVNKITKYLQSKGKTVMMWADILLNHTEQIEKLPDDVELLNWWYWDNPDEKTFEIIQRSKKPQYVCPGTSSWNRLCENYELEIINISKMIEFGFKYGADGVINTNWGDWGNPCCIELSMFGLVLGAAKSWNVSSKIDKEYISKVNFLLYKKENATEYVKRLSDLCSKIDWCLFARNYANILCDNDMFDIQFPDKKILSEVLRESFDIVNKISAENWVEAEYKEQIIIASEGVAVITEMLSLLAGYKIERKTDTKVWLEKYKNKWMQDNKKSELSEIEKMFLTINNKIEGY